MAKDSKDNTETKSNRVDTGLSSTTTSTSQSSDKSTTGNRSSIYYPQAEITIITETGNLVIKGEIKPDLTKFGNDIVSIVTKRSIGDDSPVFSLNLVYRDEWFYSIGSNDLVIIKMCRPPEKLKVRMVGLVDDIRRNFMFNQNKPQRVLTIAGRGLAKAFVTFDIGIVNEVQVSETYLGYLGQEVSLEGCAANAALDKLINAYAGAYIDYNFFDNTTLKQRIQLKLNARPDYTLIAMSNLLNYQGSLWQLMKEIQNAPFNEMFFDVEDDKETLYLRPTPFSETPWKALSLFEIMDEEIISDSLGRSDLETYALYSVSCATMLSSTSATSSFGYVPLWYPPYFKKYGVRRLDVTTLYSMYAGSQDAENASAKSLECTQDLFNWNIKNNSMYNGTLLVRGSNRFTLGSRVLLKSEGLELYVEGITEIFNVFESYQVQLNLTRGLPADDRFTEPYGKYENFDPSIFGMKVKTSDSSGSSDGTTVTDGTTVGSADVQALLAYAKTYLGLEYQYGGISPTTGFDCSGFTQYVYAHFGINIPRRSQEQSTVGMSIDAKDKSQWKPGDLLFSHPLSDGPGHVAIYLGNNQKIHSPQTHDVIKVSDVGDEVYIVRRMLS